MNQPPTIFPAGNVRRLRHGTIQPGWNNRFIFERVAVNKHPSLITLMMSTPEPRTGDTDILAGSLAKTFSAPPAPGRLQRQPSAMDFGLSSRRSRRHHANHQ
jgi:hypothetical protein